MESKKVKEIKKALEVYGKENKGITILRGGEIQVIPYTDILTLINELESENSRNDIIILKQEYLIKKFMDRIAELKEKFYYEGRICRYIIDSDVFDETLKEFIDER